ncbi:hypothetical protein [Rosistilla oblonga]|nr:hypothetical protein [Rosistilla oblonga]
MDSAFFRQPGDGGRSPIKMESKINCNAFVLYALMFVFAVPLMAQPPEQKDDISLHQAVMTFNQREARHFSETEQSENELVCALRRLPLTARGQMGQPGYRELLQMAENETLPLNAYLTILRVAYTDTHYCAVFDIQLTFKIGEKSHLTVPIRQVALSSRKIRPEERRELEQRVADFHKTPQTE